MKTDQGCHRPDRVRFLGDEDIQGTLVGENLIQWDGDDYLCVLRPDEFEKINHEKRST